LETNPSHYSARYTPELASESVSQLLAAEVTRQAKAWIRDDHLDPEDGEREQVMGSGTDTRRIAEVGD
jgi:hypothetical protein